MGFEQFLIENDGGYEEINTSQLHVIKQEIDRSELKSEISKKYIDKQKEDVKIVDEDYYASGIKLDGENVIIKGSIIVETKEEDDYNYFKPVDFVYNMSESVLLTIADNDRVRNENWKEVQTFILKTSKKI